MTDENYLILCIEDEREMIELFKIILERQGFQVSGALGGEEGLQRAAEIKPDLILLDLMMPGMDGWEVIQKLKIDRELNSIPVVVVTAKSQNIDRVLALHVARVAGYITKPFGPRELIDGVRKVLAKQTVTS